MRPLLVLALALLAGYGQVRPPARNQSFDVTLHVAQTANAADSNAGTETSPVRTIQAAADRALANRRRGRSTRIAIQPGTYRESIEVQDETSAVGAPAILFEGIGAVVVSGSDVWTTWRPVGNGIYESPWPHARGVAALPAGWEAVERDLRSNPVVRRSEMVFVNGTLLAQTMSVGDLRGRSGTFLVRDAAGPGSPGSISVHLEAGADPRRARIEVAVRPVILDVDRANNVTLQHLVFQHAATPLQDAAVQVTGAAGVVLQDVRIEWNNWYGLGVRESRDVTIRQVSSSHNGIGGLNVFRARNLVVEDMTASYNNWRGAWGGFLGWATGQKLFSVHGATLRRFRAEGNQATGLWFDTDHADITIEGARICNNATRGLFIEAVQGPFTLRDSTICSNGDIGIFATAAAGVTLERNTITGNRDHQIWIPWMDANHVLQTERNFETGRTIEIRTANWTMVGNTIEGSGESLLFSVGKWPLFFSTLRSAGNRWKHTARTDAFATYGAIHARPARMTLRNWQVASGQDATSTFNAN